MESSIDEQVQTAADDSLRSDSVPSLPDEKGNFLSHVCVITCFGRLPEPFEIFMIELVNVIKHDHNEDEVIHLVVMCPGETVLRPHTCR